MTGTDIYDDIVCKAAEVQEAWNNIVKIRGVGTPYRSGGHLLASGGVLATGDEEASAEEASAEKDPRRAVKLLYADYCMLRDELRALLKAEYEPKSA